jgi:hypothetical protein
VQETLRQVSGIEPSSDLSRQVIARYHSLRSQT